MVGLIRMRSQLSRSGWLATALISERCWRDAIGRRFEVCDAIAVADGARGCLQRALSTGGWRPRTPLAFGTLRAAGRFNPTPHNPTLRLGPHSGSVQYAQDKQG
jgi:hypothetical protein